MPTARVVTVAPESTVGENSVSRTFVITLSVLFMSTAVVLLAAVLALWPPETGVAKAAEAWIPTREQNLLVLMAALGALGATAYVLRSFSTYVGERKLVWSWVPSYVLVIFLGAIISTITYIVLRAGLIGGDGTVEGNTWGFAAVSALVGLFNAQAASKLKAIFESIFSQTAAGSDSLAADKDKG
ncbi:MAG TPA: hypothetical protein VFC71_00980 [Candidatus Polarisedimenticolia bacterium]|nr:hypothetical protein [Candidatus Polarisedimenticolia bacterium]